MIAKRGPFKDDVGMRDDPSKWRQIEIKKELVMDHFWFKRRRQ
jgi:hypothetical protein